MSKLLPQITSLSIVGPVLWSTWTAQKKRYGLTLGKSDGVLITPYYCTEKKLVGEQMLKLCKMGSTIGMQIFL